jgi:endonuclease/exonuclease/phosphatase family metal-dependent hydrolase
VTSRDSPTHSRRAVLSRRSALRAGVAAGLGLTLPSPAGAADPSATESPGTEPPGTHRAAVGPTASAELTVATYNLGLGANLFSLFLVSSTDELARTVGDLYADIERSAPAARMAAVAAELARTRPDVVGVQEAALVRTGPPGDGGAASDPDADAVAFDFLASLTDALDDADASYEVAQVTTNADAAFPGVVDGDRTSVRLTDRDAVLVRADADVEVTAASATTFAETMTVPAGDRTVDVERGYGVVAATAGDAAFTVVNTHLESASESVRGAQADELAAALAALDGPTVLLGDLNDGPAFGGGAYETLAADLTDAWDAARPDADGFTCCRATTLDGPGSMDERLDHVLVAGFAATDARLVGADAESRLTATVDGDARELWPSDHAGVVATLRSTAGGETAAGSRANETDTGGGTAGTATAPGETTTGAESASNGTANGTGTGSGGVGSANGTAAGANESAGAVDANGTDPAATGNGSARTSPGESTPTDAPGFGPLAVAVGVLGGVVELLRRRG